MLKKKIFLNDQKTGDKLSPVGGCRKPVDRDQSVKIAQQLFRIYIPAGIPLVDEFINSRREEANKEWFEG